MEQKEFKQLAKLITSNPKHFEYLKGYLQMRRDVIHRALEISTNDVELYRMQGSMRIINELLELKKTVDSFEEYHDE